MGEFATVAGAVASVVAVAAAIQQVLARRRRNSTLAQLELEVGRLLRMRRWLHAWAASVAQDPSLTEHADGYLSFYAGASDELERTVADIRAIDAEGSVERLRDDVEKAATALLRQWDEASTRLPSQVVELGLRHPFGLHSIDRAREVDVAAEERLLVTLLRSVMHRLERHDDAEGIAHVLPLDPRHEYDLDRLWGR